MGAQRAGEPVGEAPAPCCWPLRLAAAGTTPATSDPRLRAPHFQTNRLAPAARCRAAPGGAPASRPAAAHASAALQCPTYPSRTCSTVPRSTRRSTSILGRIDSGRMPTCARGRAGPCAQQGWPMRMRSAGPRLAQPGAASLPGACQRHASARRGQRPSRMDSGRAPTLRLKHRARAAHHGGPGSREQGCVGRRRRPPRVHGRPPRLRPAPTPARAGGSTPPGGAPMAILRWPASS